MTVLRKEDVDTSGKQLLLPTEQHQHKHLVYRSAGRRLCHLGLLVFILFNVACVLMVLRWYTTPSQDVHLYYGSDIDIKALASLLSVDEKIQLVHGSLSACGYTGLTRRIARFSIPELRENDGPQGFRGARGKSTAYPSAMNMAATFSTKLVHNWGKEMALEFSEKGANMLLGPGLNVARIPGNGRNFEYLSGEDPQLGSQMAEASIKGMQSVKGIIATAKHFVLNNQETARFTGNSQADDTTMNELYYPPFRAAVRAGVLSVMCAYNKVNGIYACENNETLKKLKHEWGFKGFVVSDWGGTHSTREAALAGLDQEMPLGVNFGESLKKLAKQDDAVAKQLTDKAERVLYAMKTAGLLGTPEPGCLRATDVTSPERARFAKLWAASGAVLLKNEEKTLPIQLEDGIRIALIGPDADDASIVSGGGSGHVDAGDNVVTALLGVRKTIESLMGDPDPILSYETGANASATEEAVKKANIVVIVVSTNSIEGIDRARLTYPKQANELVESVVKMASVNQAKVVVVGVCPGAMIMPWVDRVDAIVKMFLPGQAFGDALGELLFGLHNPSGRLPITFPREDGQVQFTQDQYPGVNGTSRYTEGLLTGYRWHDYYNVEPQFSFGHGLSFTTFEYHNSSVGHIPFFQTYYLTVYLSNTGSKSGHEVVQVYLARENCTTLCTAINRPKKRLIKFKRVFLDAGQTLLAKLSFDFDDIAEWHSRKQKWVWPRDKCHYQLHIGSSSTDIRISHPIKL